MFMVDLDKISFRNKKVLIRVDFNLPVTHQGVIIDDRRVHNSLPTIQKVIQDGGIAILLSHFGRPQHGYEKKYSLHNLVPLLSGLLQQPVLFAPNCIGQEVQRLADTLTPGNVLLLENVRFHKEETLANSDFAQALSGLADVYVNEAFGTIHRNHASTSLLPTYFKERYAGYLLQQEIAIVDKLFSKSQRPVVAIMGGSKLVDKAKPIEGLIPYVDHILIGGGLILPFYQAQHAAIDPFYVHKPAELIASRLFDALRRNSHCQLSLPTDVLTVPEMQEQATISTLSLADIPNGTHVVDIGLTTQSHFTKLILEAKTILWAGLVGVFEWTNCSYGTRAIAQAMAKATEQGAYSIVGGGDTAAAVKQLGYDNTFSHICTGGSALLAYIASNRKLPTLEALKGA